MSEREKLFLKIAKSILGKEFDLEKFKHDNAKLLEVIYTSMAASFGEGVATGYDMTTKKSLELMLKLRKN